MIASMTFGALNNYQVELFYALLSTIKNLLKAPDGTEMSCWEV